MMEMKENEKREKVIKGLECCAAYEYKCNDCPYQDDGGAEDDCYSDELCADALALLKAQEPMTVNERRDLEILRRVKSGKILKHGCTDYVIYNGEWYRKNPWNHPQKPVKPVFDAGDGKTIGQFLCGKCHAKIGFGHPHFCWYCGRAVKWE